MRKIITAEADGTHSYHYKCTNYALCCRPWASIYFASNATVIVFWGSGRLPHFVCRSKVPYIKRICSEPASGLVPILLNYM